MNTYPADEQRISEVERGRSCEAVVPLPPGGSLAAGDTEAFKLALRNVAEAQLGGMTALSRRTDLNREAL